MSDSQLAEAMHAKFYSDMPKEQFYQKINFTPSQAQVLPQAPEPVASQGLAGVGQDVLSGLKSAPSALLESLISLPGAALSAGKTALTHPVRGLEDIGAGALKGTTEALNLPYVLSKYLGSKGLLKIPKTGMDLSSLSQYIPHLPDVDYAQKLGITEPTSGDVLLQGIGQFAPFGAVGEAGAASRAVMPQLARRTAAAATGGAAMTPESPVSGAALGGVLGVTPDLLAKALPKSMSPEALAKIKEASRVAGQTPTQLGEVLGSPLLKQQFENVLAPTPFSGATGKMTQAAEQITNQAEDVVSSIAPNISKEKIEPKLQRSLKQALKDAQEQKTQNYKEVNDLADKKGVVINRVNFSSKAKEILDDLNGDETLKKEVSPSVVSDLERYSEIQPHKLKGANIFRGKLGDKLNKNYIAGDTYESGVYGKLKDALSKDINNAIDASGDTKLKTSYDKAQKFYMENIAPFEEPEIVKFTKKGGDPDTILQTFIKPSKFTDRSHLIDKLVSKLPQEDRNLPAYGWLSNAKSEKVQGRIDPGKLSTMWQNLGENQQKSLVPSESMRKALSDVSKLSKLNSAALNVMHNPATGATVKSWMPLLLAHGAGGAIGSSLAGPLGAFAGAAGTGLGMRPVTAALTSPLFRKILVHALGAKQRIGQGIPKTPIRPSTGALMALSQNQTGGQ